MSKSRYASIPDFTNNTDSIGTALRATKNIVDQLAGHTQDESLGAPNMYVQATEPGYRRQIALKKGDLWINTQANDLRYWTGTTWKTLG